MELLIILFLIGIVFVFLILKCKIHRGPSTDIPVDTKNLKYGPWVTKVWTLSDFCKEFGPKMYVKYDYINSQTKEKFAACTFVNKNGRPTFVGFYESLGVLSKEEIIKRKHELKIGVNSEGHYKLYIGIDRFVTSVNLK